MSADITPNELKVIAEKKKAYDDAIKNKSQDMPDKARQYHDAVINAILTGDLPISEGCGANPDPSNEHVKEGGWGGDTAAAAMWDAVEMKDTPGQWKIVDKGGVNVAHKFTSEAEAEAYIKYHRCMQEKGDVDPIPTPDPEPIEQPQPQPGGPSAGEPGSGVGQYPYPAKGSPMQSTQRGPTTRHYASGKPDDETIEKNIKNIKFDNYQFVCYVTINKMEHDDDIAQKLGGLHMDGNGWFDNGVGIYNGETCLGTEPKHPTTKLCIIKGPKIGDIRGKKLGMASIYRKKENKTELWVDFPAGSGWKKKLEGANVGGLNPKSATNEAQLRIDGFVKGSVPTIHSAVVTEI
jgi:hypothetical protein